MSNNDIATKVTAELIGMLEAGVAPWHKPWKGGNGSMAPINAATRRAYRGINIFVLWAAEMRLNVTGGGWLTYRQAESLGGHVRKGEKGTAVVFWKMLDVKDDDRKVPFLRYFTVFHTSQCEGLTLPTADAPVETTEIDEVEAAEALVAGYSDKPTIAFGGEMAYYRPSLDHVQMPERSAFTSSGGYYSTLFHELAHSTGHVSRLNRKEIAEFARFGDESYSTEELTAEMTAAFCCARVGIDASTLPQSASYLKCWLKALKAEPKMLITAAARAQRAFDYITNTKPEAVEE